MLQVTVTFDMQITFVVSLRDLFRSKIILKCLVRDFSIIYIEAIIFACFSHLLYIRDFNHKQNIRCTKSETDGTSDDHNYQQRIVLSFTMLNAFSFRTR